MSGAEVLRPRAIASIGRIPVPLHQRAVSHRSSARMTRDMTNSMIQTFRRDHLSPPSGLRLALGTLLARAQFHARAASLSPPRVDRGGPSGGQPLLRRPDVMGEFVAVRTPARRTTGGSSTSSGPASCASTLRILRISAHRRMAVRRVMENSPTANGRHLLPLSRHARCSSSWAIASTCPAIACARAPGGRPDHVRIATVRCLAIRSSR